MSEEQTIYIEELYACPFCGLPGQLKDMTPEPDPMWGPGPEPEWWFAGCEKCDIWFSGDPGHGQTDAAALWNRRAPRVCERCGDKLDEYGRCGSCLADKREEYNNLVTHIA